LLVTLSGAEILVTVKAPLPVIVHVGMQGVAGYLVPVIILVCGILLLFSPGQRLFYSIVAALMVLASWVTSNLGGFVFGMLLGLLGSALAFAWAPVKTGRHKPAHAGPAPGPAEPPGPPAAPLGLAELGLASDAAGPPAGADAGPSTAEPSAAEPSAAEPAGPSAVEPAGPEPATPDEPEPATPDGPELATSEPATSEPAASELAAPEESRPERETVRPAGDPADSGARRE